LLLFGKIKLITHSNKKKHLIVCIINFYNQFKTTAPVCTGR